MKKPSLLGGIAVVNIREQRFLRCLWNNLLKELQRFSHLVLAEIRLPRNDSELINNLTYSNLCSLFFFHLKFDVQRKFSWRACKLLS